MQCIVRPTRLLRAPLSLVSRRWLATPSQTATAGSVASATQHGHHQVLPAGHVGPTTFLGTATGKFPIGPISHAPATVVHEGIDLNQPHTAQEYIDAVPVIEVDGPTAICDGGDPRLGHPIEYIQLNKVKNEPAVCKYCGLRFVQAHHH